MLPEELLALVNDCIAAGLFGREEAEILLDFMAEVRRQITTAERQEKIQDARRRLLASMSKAAEGDPFPARELNMYFNARRPSVILPERRIVKLSPFFAAGVIKKVRGTNGIEPTAIWLLPRLFLRVGHVLAEELSLSARQQLEKSRQAWQQIGTETKNLLVKKTRQAVRQWKSMFDEDGNKHTLEELDPKNLYDSGWILYQNDSQAIFVFAMTSGLIVPSEYDPKRYGYGEMKYPGRVRYFEEGVLNTNEVRLKRFYQWDRYGTAVGLYKNCQARGEEIIKQAATGILARALQMPNFGLTEADFGRADERLGVAKKHVTLTCFNGLVISNRDPKTRSIAAHSLYAPSVQDEDYRESISRYLEDIDEMYSPEWDVRFLERGGDTRKHSIPWVIYHRLYQQEATRVVKQWRDPPLDQDTARAQAREVIERLYSEGERIVTNNLDRAQFWKD